LKALEVFENPEVYDLEFVDQSGTSSRFAYLVRPDQIINVETTDQNKPFTIRREAEGEQDENQR
jgi:hypothetical protein